MTRVRVGVAAILLAALGAGGTWTGHAEAASAPRPTGQVDQATTVRGQLRQDLLAASAPDGDGGYPDPRQPIVIRSSLRLAGARVLLVAFRSLAGRTCLGVAFAGSGSPATPPRCLPPCRETVCLSLFRGGPLPRGTRVLAGTASPRIEELRVASPSGSVLRYRVSRSRVGAAAPILARVSVVRRVGAYANGRELVWVRFPA